MALRAATTVPPTFTRLAQLEPQLQRLLEEAQLFHRYAGETFCANAVWYGERAGYTNHEGLKSRLERLVGDFARQLHPQLRTGDAYDVAYDTVYDALPDCRGDCTCQFGPALEPIDVNVLKRGPRPAHPLNAQKPAPDPAAVRAQWVQLQPLLTPAVLELSGYRCAICRATDGLTVDHVVPIERGGTNDIRNLRALCKGCNSRKGAR